MPPSQRSSCKSSDEVSGGRLSGLSTQYIDIDIVAGKAESKRSHSGRSDHGRSRAAGRSHAWGGEPQSNLQIEVGDRRFYLHKFPLVLKSNRLKRLVGESRDAEKPLSVAISDIPGGAAAFEFIARYVYSGKLELSPHNVAAVRCAAEYLEMTDEGNKSDVVIKTEDYLNHVVVDSWRDSITVLKSCSDLTPWEEDLEIVRRCSESIAWKCCNTETKSLRDAHWWFEDVCSLTIDTFSRIVRAATAMGMNSSQIVGHYAEKWLQLTRGSDMSTTLKIISTKESTESPRAASFVAFTGFNQDIVAKDAKQTQHKNRAILQGIVNLLPPQASNSLSVKFLLKLLQVACLVNAGSFCKTDLAKRIAYQLEKASLDDLLIPASSDSTYDVDVVQQIVEFYIQDQSYKNSPPASPRSTVSGASSITSRSSGVRSLTSSGSSSDLRTSSRASFSTATRSGGYRSSDSSSVSDSDTESSFSGSSISKSSISGSSISGSSVSRSSVNGSGSSRLSSSSGSFRSASSHTTDSSSRSSGSRASSETSATTTTTSNSSSSSGSSSGFTSNESVKLETKKSKPAFYDSESPNGKTLLAPTTANFKVARLLETYLEEVAKDSSITFGQFIKLAELVTEFPRDSDDSIYRAIDGFLKAHPILTETERKNLCRLMDTGALSLAASVHAVSNERLPVRVIVQLLFIEQVKLRNEMTANEAIHEKKDLGDKPPSFSSTTTSTTTSSSESSSDGTSSSSSSSSSLSSGSSSSSSSLSSGSSSTSASSRTLSSRSRKSRSRKLRSRSLSISSASALNLNLAIPTPPSTPSVASAVSSHLPGGLSVKETLRFVLAEIGSLRRSVQEIDAVKSRLGVVETLKMEMESLSTKFQEMSHDYIGMTQQVEELTKSSSSKNTKSGWSSGWKKVAKSFQSKDSHDHKSDSAVPPLPPVLLPQQPGTEAPAVPVLRTSKSDTLHPKTPRADTMPSSQTKTTTKSDSFPGPKTTTKTHSSIITQTPKKGAKAEPLLPAGKKTPKMEPPVPAAKTTPKKEPGLGPSAKTTATKESFPFAQRIPKLEPLMPIAKPTPKIEPLLPGAKATPRMESSPVPKTTPKANLALNSKQAAWRDHVKSASASSLGSTPSSGSLKKEMLDPVHTPRQETVLKSGTSTPATSKRQPEKDVAASATGFKRRGKDDYAITAHRSHHVEDVHRKSTRSRSASPDYVQRPATTRQVYNKSNSNSASASVTSTSSYATSNAVSRRSSERRYRRRGRNGGHGRDGYKGHKVAEKNSSGRTPSQRQKDGSNGHKEHVSVDSHPGRHSSATQPHSHHNSGHHRYQEGSVGSQRTREGSEHHSGSHRSGHRIKERHGHGRHHQHHRHPDESFSDSDASRDVSPRRRNR